MGPSECRILTRRHLFMIAMESGGANITEKLGHMESYLFKMGPFSEEDTINFGRDVRRLKSDFKARFNKSKQRRAYLKNKTRNG